MATGKVKRFNDPKGLGFIMADDGTDIFVHCGNIQGEGFKSVAEDEAVTFDLTRGPEYPKAVNVRKGWANPDVNPTNVVADKDGVS